MVLTKNKFKAKHHITPARLMPGVHSHPGFHTTNSLEIAGLYAIVRCNDSEHEGSYSFHFVLDYPVVAILDMRGFKKHLDYDADITVREVLEDQIKCIVDEHVDIINYDDKQIQNIVWRECDSYESCFGDVNRGLNVIDAYSAHIYNFMEFPLRIISEENWTPQIIKEYAKTRRFPDWVLMYITGQYRYLQDIPEDRVMGLYYLRPLSPDSFDYEDDVSKWPGFDCENIFEIDVYSPTYTLVYGRDVLEDKQIDIFEHTPGVEYHGTTLSLFKKAAPVIGSNLPEPPCPPYKPDEMTQKEYHKKVLEIMKKHG